ncbi:MAG: DUF1905 domain-containing protein [Acidobacteria bacterium]|nr:DUF1905 domain-containing protein [Acidobacteriota bacterium]
MNRFESKIKKIGINPVVDPPEDVLTALFEQAGKSKGPIPVCGNLNGAAFIQTLVKYAGKWRLYINGPMLADSGLKVGDTAKVEIAFDPRPRKVPMPALFRKALQNNAAAGKAFKDLTASRQKEILRYLGSLKTEKSLLRNVETIARQLAGKPVDKPHVVMRMKKKN